MSEGISTEVLAETLLARISAHEVIFLAFIAAISASEEQVGQCRSMLETILDIAKDKENDSFISDQHREALRQLAKNMLDSLEKAQQRKVV